MGVGGATVTVTMAVVCSIGASCETAVGTIGVELLTKNAAIQACSPT